MTTYFLTQNLFQNLKTVFFYLFRFLQLGPKRVWSIKGNRLLQSLQSAVAGTIPVSRVSCHVEGSGNNQ